MTPQSVGIRQSQLVLGKHSGRHALSERVKSLGFELNDVELNHIFKEFKQLADVKRQVFDEDIESLITNNVRKQNNPFELQHLTVTSGTTSVPTATITMRVGNDVVRKAGFGDGPVDAALNTIKQITEQNCTLTSYVVKAITGGTDAQGEVSVTVEHEGQQVTGRGAHTDIILASALAFVHALNRLEARSSSISLMTPLQQEAAAV